MVYNATYPDDAQRKAYLEAWDKQKDFRSKNYPNMFSIRDVCGKHPDKQLEAAADRLFNALYDSFIKRYHLKHQEDELLATPLRDTDTDAQIAARNAETDRLRKGLQQAEYEADLAVYTATRETDALLGIDPAIRKDKFAIPKDDSYALISKTIGGAIRIFNLETGRAFNVSPRAMEREPTLP